MIEKEKPVRGQLYVITCFNRLFEYLLNILDNAPKKYRYTFVIRIENMLLDINEELILANLTKIEDTRRGDRQNGAYGKLIVLANLLRMAMNGRCLSFHQYEISSNYLKETKDCLLRWMKSDVSRVTKMVD